MIKRLVAAGGAAALLLLAACGNSSDSGGKDTTSGSTSQPSQTNAYSTTAGKPVTGSPGTSSGDGSAAPVGTKTCEWPADGQAAKRVSPPPATPTVSGKVTVQLDTSIGKITATLNATATPCTVESFVSLAGQGYFDGTSCHRMTTQGIFVLQCGDPTGTGRGGPGYRFADELNGSETYPAGTLAMANAGANTNGSQFFVVYENTPLPPNYTVFGTVDAAAVDLIKKVAQAGTDDSNGPGDGAPKTPVQIKAVTVG